MRERNGYDVMHVCADNSHNLAICFNYPPPHVCHSILICHYNCHHSDHNYFSISQYMQTLNVREGEREREKRTLRPLAIVYINIIISEVQSYVF